MIIKAFVVLLAVLVVHAKAIDIAQLRRFAAKNNVSCMYVFGDSSVDPGNNNNLMTDIKVNFLPYGKDFYDGRPTGRFTNGRLATDLIADALGHTKAIPAYLDPNLTNAKLVMGVSFASGGSGYDDLTAQLSDNDGGSKPPTTTSRRHHTPSSPSPPAVTTTFTPVVLIECDITAKQLEYFREYKARLGRVVRKKRGRKIVTNSVFLLSMGTNDFLQNYYVEPTRSKQFTLDKYQDFLISAMTKYIKAMHAEGATRLAVVGMEPFGCSPLIRALKGTVKCDDEYNKAALSFNSKIKSHMATLGPSLAMKIFYVDIYGLVQDTIQNPKKYGFVETSKGCCGSGLDYGQSCKGLPTCVNRSKYVYWDAVHFTEKMYKIISEEALKSLMKTLA